MRWEEVVPREGDMRERSYFAWLPVSVIHGQYKTTVWLETVHVVEEYKEVTGWKTIQIVFKWE